MKLPGISSLSTFWEAWNVCCEGESLFESSAALLSGVSSSMGTSTDGVCYPWILYIWFTLFKQHGPFQVASRAVGFPLFFPCFPVSVRFVLDWSKHASGREAQKANIPLFDSVQQRRDCLFVRSARDRAFRSSRCRAFKRGLAAAGMCRELTQDGARLRRA